MKFSFMNFETIDLTTDMNKPGSRIQRSKLKPLEMTNLEYQDGGQSAFPNKLPYLRKFTESQNSG